MTYLPFPRLWTHVALVAMLGSAAGAQLGFPQRILAAGHVTMAVPVSDIKSMVICPTPPTP